MARRRLDSFRHAAEQRFKHRVDIEVVYPGLGQRLNELLDWCRDNVKQDDWAQHGYMEKPNSKDVPRDYVRFYFEHREMAELFITEWGGKLVDD